ncbi:hypothetical protein [Chitinophaga sp. HK235]|uniref:hypothetical protein n=1 Tax=Chitinophaga sp. HK235 TaxID=2952571 RepID=UPI001BAA9CAE|nr:hypothetical protein [Chitinophaga sp. HK235]
MADKKITQLTQAVAISANDLVMVCQNQATGELLQSTAGALRQFVLGGANAGARIYFTVGVPAASLGVDGDVCFDKQGHAIYQKVTGTWMLQDTYSSSGTGGVDRIRFTAAYGSGGLAADGKSYTNASLSNAIPTAVWVEADALIGVGDFGTTPAFDEWDFNPIAGKIIFGSPVPAGTRITIIYSL